MKLIPSLWLLVLCAFAAGCVHETIMDHNPPPETHTIPATKSIKTRSS
ncbi:MAG TPA: hypothetical protein VMF06_08445 [Candidatus Limnocylindria bacterium]|nr:hypothetical protein [Candidatus Limnocylindria bacterium]